MFTYFYYVYVRLSWRAKNKVRTYLHTRIIHITSSTILWLEGGGRSWGSTWNAGHKIDILSLHIVAIVQCVVFMYVFVCLGTRKSAEIRRSAWKKNLKSHQAGIDRKSPCLPSCQHLLCRLYDLLIFIILSYWYWYVPTGPACYCMMERHEGKGWQRCVFDDFSRRASPRCSRCRLARRGTWSKVKVKAC